MDANVLGLVHTFQPFIASMPAGGVLCGISSVAGVRGLPGGGAYSASKAAATVYLEALRLELKARGVAVVTVAPGYIDTPMTQVNPYAMPFRRPRRLRPPRWRTASRAAARMPSFPGRWAGWRAC